jgi:hypothetical protein
VAKKKLGSGGGFSEGQQNFMLKKSGIAGKIEAHEQK